MKKILIRLQIIFYKLRIWIAESPRRAFVTFLLVTLLLAIAGGFIVAPQKAKVFAPPTEVATHVFTDSMKVYSIKVPDNWVEQTDIAAEAASEEVVALAPKARIEAYEDRTGSTALLHTTIALYHTNDSPTDWFDKQQLGTPVESQELDLPGKTAYGAKIVTENYSDDHYVVTSNGVLLHLTFHRITKSYNPDHTDDFSADLGAFDKIFTSLTFSN